jgi:hypothetical protein
MVDGCMPGLCRAAPRKPMHLHSSVYQTIKRVVSSEYMQQHLRHPPDWCSCCVMSAVIWLAAALPAPCLLTASAAQRRKLRPAAQPSAAVLLLQPVAAVPVPSSTSPRVRLISCSGRCAAHATRLPALRAACCCSIAVRTADRSAGSPVSISVSNWLSNVKQRLSCSSWSVVRDAGGASCSSCVMLELLMMLWSSRATSSARLR